MMGILKDQSRIRKVTLCKVHHSDASFESVIDFIDRASYLKEIDVSWSGVRPPLMLKLMEQLRYNSTLSHICIAYNQLLVEQPESLTEEEIA